ncbi:DUF5684 domain-containing protein [Lentzea flaviverrucosa]|uniref:Signal peptidase I n=1 Tax=Lentzea flaviverrucosa TaxID=200379 RepID=A0A1H9U5F1_9PSEU|nr:DUF5684 domain-containing protein [Lentzea flaviverrucosa]RDI33303.1 hypothetical protein DFR72_102552 [Lentzea flaviverrucosa]SES04394.1 hypothetical protein SAMN05216195_108305 [Lentzea flaviverrucosa]
MDPSQPTLTEADTAALLGTLAVFGIIGLIITVIAIVVMWKTFAKAGQPGWAAIVPIYNLYVLTQIGGRPGWWTVLLLIPGVNVVVLAILSIDVAKSFGKDAVFGIVGLWLFSIVGYAILGFGNAQYRGPAALVGAQGAYRG